MPSASSKRSRATVNSHGVMSWFAGRPLVLSRFVLELRVTRSPAFPNVTSQAAELEMMKEAVPHATRIGVLWNPTTPSHQRALKSIEAAGEELRVELRMIPARTLENFEEAFSTMTREVVEAFLVVASPLIVAQRVPLARLAVKHRLPGYVPVQRKRGGGRLHELRRGPRRPLAAGSGLR